MIFLSPPTVARTNNKRRKTKLAGDPYLLPPLTTHVMGHDNISDSLQGYTFSPGVGHPQPETLGQVGPCCHAEAALQNRTNHITSQQPSGKVGGGEEGPKTRSQPRHGVNKQNPSRIAHKQGDIIVQNTRRRRRRRETDTEAKRPINPPSIRHSLGWWRRRRGGQPGRVGLWLLPVLKPVTHGSPRLRDELLHRLPLGRDRRVDDERGVPRLEQKNEEGVVRGRMCTPQRTNIRRADKRRNKKAGRQAIRQDTPPRYTARG